MKILAIHNFHRKGSASGDDQVFKSETALLEDHGHEIVRYTVSNDEFDNTGVIGKFSAALGMLWSFKNYKKVKKLVETEKPDIVHIHTFFRYFHHRSCTPQKEAVQGLLQHCMIPDLSVPALLL